MTIDELKQQLKELNERTLHIPVKAPSRQNRAKTNSQKARDMSGWKKSSDYRIKDRINSSNRRTK
tara:strand:+ start:272 stop:466 length:195 start_codon:yes stop_codon:yes gene_type:complete